MITTRRLPSNGRYPARSTTSRTCSILMLPLSPGSTISTSGCMPRAMRVQLLQVPQASARSDPAVMLGQFSAWAVAAATKRLPTPSGPAKIKLGGSEARDTARASRSTRRRWPMTSRKGIASSRRIVSLAATEEAAPEPAFLFGFVGLLGCGGWRNRLWSDSGSSGGNLLRLFRRSRRVMDAQHRGDGAEEAADLMDIAVLVRLGAFDEIFGVDRRFAIGLTVVAEHLGILASVGRPFSAETANLGRDDPGWRHQPQGLVALG